MTGPERVVRASRTKRQRGIDGLDAPRRDGVVDVHGGDGMHARPAASPDMGDPRVYELARQLFFKCFSVRLGAVGVDLDDAMQEILLRLFTRSTSPSRWDPKRGALSTWMYVAMTGIVLNMHDKHCRYLRRSGSVGAREDISISLRAVESEAA